jgi:hypothetical protein
VGTRVSVSVCLSVCLSLSLSASLCISLYIFLFIFALTISWHTTVRDRTAVHVHGGQVPLTHLKKFTSTVNGTDWHPTSLIVTLVTASN